MFHFSPARPGIRDQCQPKELAQYCRNCTTIPWGRVSPLKKTRCSLREIVNIWIRKAVLRSVSRIPHMGLYVLRAPVQARNHYPFRGESDGSTQRLLDHTYGLDI